MTYRAIIDFGSRSTKVYINDGVKTELVFTYNRDLISIEPSQEDIKNILATVITVLQNVKKIEAIATEAARRSTSLEFMLADSCDLHGISYQTISQQTEADLIQLAFSNDNQKSLEVINVGGGSIQIVRPNKTFFLLTFGITDLNKAFFLNEAPGKRQFDECKAFIKQQLPADLGSFIYTGGEVTYLKVLGANLMPDGGCLKSEFIRVSQNVIQMENDALEKISPFGKNWMTGAIASNCFVEAALEKSGSDVFYPSDQNIAHGLAHQLMRNTL